MQDLLGKIRRGLKKPPKYILFRIWHEVKSGMEQYIAPSRERSITMLHLTREMRCQDFSELWVKLYEADYPFWSESIDRLEYEKYCPGSAEKILHRAEKAMAYKVDLMGSGEIFLGEEIRWAEDYKTGNSWPNQYFNHFNYNNPELPSDVKFPWELSRLQWLIPVAQAYLLSGDEKYAAFVRKILEHWIENNPYAHSINWACTMEVAIRLVSWVWFFKTLGKSKAWADKTFQFNFLKILYLHGDFTERHIEKSDINGNHYTADAAAMVFIGLFFRGSKNANRWHNEGWKILENEIMVQVFEDGVDFEASVPYHRLVQELFLYSAIYRLNLGYEVSEKYRLRLRNMVSFTKAYTKKNGSVPLWGDADDARTIPFGDQGLNDHRYLIPVFGYTFGNEEMINGYKASLSEIFWILGPEAATLIKAKRKLKTTDKSMAFEKGGFFIMKNEEDHVFIDCGPIGLAGRGGHGHNDILSFEAMLAGQPIVSDCGAYIYTGSYKERNNFRSTAYHNTPMIDGVEVNRFIRDDYIWLFHNDAIPDVRQWTISEEVDVFVGSHSGYEKLDNPVTPVRTIKLFHKEHRLEIVDKFEGEGEHFISIPLHLSPGNEVEVTSKSMLKIISPERDFILKWSDENEWDFSIGKGRISESYGVLEEIIRLVWSRKGNLNAELGIEISELSLNLNSQI